MQPLSPQLLNERKTVPPDVFYVSEGTIFVVFVFFCLSETRSVHER